MYKITLYNYNCIPCASGVISVFVDDIDDFYNKWVHGVINNESQIDRFNRSRSGEIVTDYYDNSPEFNIVQQDETAKIHNEFMYTIKDKWLNLYNSYMTLYKAHFDELNIYIRYIEYNGNYYKLESYNATGCCRKFGDLRDIDNFGNHFIQLSCKPKYFDSLSIEEREGKQRNLDEFSSDTLEAFVWYIVAEYKTIDKMYKDIKHKRKLNKSEIIDLMRDIPGEAG